MKRNVKDSLSSLDFLKRLLIYSLLTLFMGCTQCAFFPLLDFLPATPDLIIVMLTAIALLDSNNSAAVCAVAAGFFVDSIGASGPALSPLIYFLTVLLIGSFTGKMLKSLPSFLLLLLPTLLCRALGTFFGAMAFYRSLPPVWVFTRAILPEALFTLLFAVPVYFLVKLCTVPLKKRGKFTF